MKNVLLACTLWFFTLSAHATLISIDIEDKFYGVGDTLTANIYISGINNGFQELIASFELDLMSPDSLLTFTSVTFGDKLRVAPYFDSDQDFDNSIVNTLYVTEFSYAWWDELLPVQDGLDSFILASIDFTVIASGIADFSIMNIVASDDLGDSYNVSTQGKSITVGRVAEVPEPNTIILMFLGLLGCFALGRKKLG